MLRKSSFLLSVVYTILLTVSSLLKLNLDLEHIPSNSDKLFHAIAYTLFTIVWFTTFHFSFNIRFNKALIIAAILSFSYGIVIELLQGWITISRESDVKDVIANTIGMIFAIIIVLSIKNRLLKNNNTLLF